ncbi:SDR family oxidoreductase [Streptomyces sp. NPDC004096]
MHPAGLDGRARRHRGRQLHPEWRACGPERGRPRNRQGRPAAPHPASRRRTRAEGAGHSPGLVRTETARSVRAHGEDAVAAGMPLRRFGRLEDVARAVLRPASDTADRITGTHLPGDGGTRAGPAYVPESSASGTYAIRHRLRSCAPHRI